MTVGLSLEIQSYMFSTLATLLLVGIVFNGYAYVEYITPSFSRTVCYLSFLYASLDAFRFSFLEVYNANSF